MTTEHEERLEAAEKRLVEITAVAEWEEFYELLAEIKRLARAPLEMELRGYRGDETLVWMLREEAEELQSLQAEVDRIARRRARVTMPVDECRIVWCRKPRLHWWHVSYRQAQTTNPNAYDRNFSHAFKPSEDGGQQ